MEQNEDFVKIEKLKLKKEIKEGKRERKSLKITVEQKEAQIREYESKLELLGR